MKTGPHLRFRRGGVALVIILAFLVLLTGLTVAFLSRAITARQVSDSSAAQVRTEVLARSAMDTIVGDLKQEIVAGSAPTSAPPGPPVYDPTSRVNVVPQRSGIPALGTGGTPPIPNLIRRSVRSDNIPTPGVGSRASTLNSTTDFSANGRSVNIARWNSHYLIPCQDTSASADCTPISAFTPPDWVMVTTSGPKVLIAPDATTIGRYAYAIYDEGGLLDANVAGFPQPAAAPSGTPYPAYKGSLAFADLTQLPLSASSSLTPTQANNNLVGWRNYATAQPAGSMAAVQSNGSVTGGYSFADASANRYYQYIIGNTTGFLTVNPSPSPSPVTASSRTDQSFTSRAALLRFSRATGMSKNALQYLGTFSRELNQPNFIPKAYPVPGSGLSPAPITYAGDASNSNPSDTNPIVQNIVYTNATATNKGQPVVSQRFPLSRLALFNDPVNSAADIKKYFGLSRGSGSVVDGYTWNYVGSTGTSSTYPRTLTTIAGLAPASGSTAARAPDFFETIQAAVLKGSLGVYTTPANPFFDGTHPDMLARTVMQIGVDLIDQYKSADGMPTTIALTPPWQSGTKTLTILVSGQQNLPYFSELLLWPYRPLSDSDRITLNVYLLVELWNPHRNASSLTGPTGFIPTELRLCLDARSDNILVNKDATGGGSMSTILPSGSNVTEVPAGDVRVEFNNSTRFAEPTVLDTALVNPVPANSATGVGMTATAGWATVSEGANVRSGFLVGSDSIKFPDQRLTPPSPNKITVVEFTGSGNPHLHLQFQDQGGTWRDYQGAYTNVSESPTLTLPIQNGDWTSPETAFSEYATNAANVSFSNFASIAQLSMGQEDPRGTIAGSPALTESTYNLSMRPGTGVNPSGAWVKLGAVGTYPSYDYPVTSSVGADHGGYATGTPIGYLASYNENARDASDAFKRANSTALNTYTVDIDGVLRPGDGYYGSDPYRAGNLAYRPVILNRAFRSVGEMGYAYRGASWKSVNFFSPESGDAGLLDFFTMDAVPVAAGKINLNTQQPAVLQAALMGAYRTQPVFGSAPETLSVADASKIANAIVAHTTQTPGSQAYPVGPLASRADLVRDLLADPTLANPPGTTAATGAIDTAGTTGNTVKEKREAFIRALADVGTTRTWNLLIDVVAQTGSYPPNATKLSQFNVQGEKHYWMHVAIDRYTGTVVDQQVEAVDE